MLGIYWNHPIASVNDQRYIDRDESMNKTIAADSRDQETPEGMERCEVPIAGETFVYFQKNEPQRRATATSNGTDRG